MKTEVIKGIEDFLTKYQNASGWSVSYSPIGQPISLVLRDKQNSKMCTILPDCVLNCVVGEHNADEVYRTVVLGFYATFHNIEDHKYQNKLMDVCLEFIEAKFGTPPTYTPALNCCYILETILSNNDTSLTNKPYINLTEDTEEILIKHLGKLNS